MIMQMPILFLLAMAFPVAAQEGVYRWIDAQGRTHYGNQPPANVQVEKVNLNSQPVKVMAGEQVYTWVDEQGNKHYSDRPPVNGQAGWVDMNTMPMSTIRATEFRPGERKLLNQLEQQKR